MSLVPPLSSTVTLGSVSFGFFCRAKLVPTTLALRTTSYLSMETEYMPWQSALDNLQYFFLMLDRTDVYPPMQVQLFSSSCPCQTSLPPLTRDSTSTGLHTEAGHTSFSALQEHHIRLDDCSGEAHGPVSTTQHPHADRTRYRLPSTSLPGQAQVLFFVFMSSILEKDCSPTHGANISRAFLAMAGNVTPC